MRMLISLVTRQTKARGEFRWETFKSVPETVEHLVGGVLIGLAVGAVHALRPRSRPSGAFVALALVCLDGLGKFIFRNII